MKNLFIVGNEKISLNNKYFYSANIDFKTIIEGLQGNFHLKILARKSLKKENFIVNNTSIVLSTNIFNYLSNVISSLKKNNIYLVISITPYTFIAFLILFFFKNKIYLYLRSDGFKEYESILGKHWDFLYKIMFSFMIKRTEIISCQKDLSKGMPYSFVRPSELDDQWFVNRKINLPTDNIKFLFVGRVRVEKGIFYLLDMFCKINSKFYLTIIGDKKINFEKYPNINFFYFFNNVADLILQYDLCDIFILPSYTESHPKVIDEALSRLKPIIIFDDIEHVIEDRIGIFKVRRDLNDLLNMVDHIKKNYAIIVDKIYKNKLPTKKLFLDNLVKIIK
jgi:glycosyltransferase involved in cell wall biosynthesis